MHVRRPSRRISKIENGRRSSGSSPGRGLHHDELAGPRRRGDLRRARARARCSRATAGCWRSPRRATSTGMRRQVYATAGPVERSAYDRCADALPPHAHERDRRWRARRRCISSCSCCSSIRRCRSCRSTAARWFGALLAFYGPYLSVGALPAASSCARRSRRGRCSRRGSACGCSRGWARRARRRGRGRHVGESARLSRRCSTRAAAERMRQGAAATTVFAVVLRRRSSLLRYSFGRRGSRAAAALLVASMVLVGRGAAVAARAGRAAGARRARRDRQPTPRSRTPPRVRLILLDGASLGFIRAARRRRAAAELRQAARSRRRRSISRRSSRRRPSRSGPRRPPASTRRRTASDPNAIYRVARRRRRPGRPAAGLLLRVRAALPGLRRRDEPLTSASLRARPMWDILADYGVAVRHRRTGR